MSLVRFEGGHSTEGVQKASLFVMVMSYKVIKIYKCSTDVNEELCKNCQINARAFYMEYIIWIAREHSGALSLFDTFQIFQVR